MFFIGLVVGVLAGAFLVGLLKCGRISDLEADNARLRELSYGRHLNKEG